MAPQSTTQHGILLVAFGTTIPEAQAAYHHIEKRIQETYPQIPVRWAYTAAMVRRKLAKQGIIVSSPATALSLMADEGFTHVAVQSLHVIPGLEYHDLLRIAHAMRWLPKGIRQICVGDPLLSTHTDMERTAEGLHQWSLTFRSPHEALVMMGHGTPHPANVYYPGMQYYFDQRDANMVMGTIEGYPTIDNVMTRLKANGIQTVWLMPLLTVAGDHAIKDMAGETDQSWKTILEREGFEVKLMPTGLGMMDAMVDIWIDHLKVAINKLRTDAELR